MHFSDRKVVETINIVEFRVHCSTLFRLDYSGPYITGRGHIVLPSVSHSLLVQLSPNMTWPFSGIKCLQNNANLITSLLWHAIDVTQQF